MSRGPTIEEISTVVEAQDSYLRSQVGGDHYLKMPYMQPGPFCERNKLTHYESNVIKYVCRHRYKGGKLDLEKARDYINMLIEENYE